MEGGRETSFPVSLTGEEVAFVFSISQRNCTLTLWNLQQGLGKAERAEFKVWHLETRQETNPGPGPSEAAVSVL